MLDQEDIQRILELLDATPLAHFELQTERFKITLRREGQGGWTQEQAVFRADGSAAAAAAPAEMRESVALSGHTPAAPGRAIRAPLIGTFYRSPQPGAPPFVDVGSTVGADTVVAIVETMKLMTSIHAGHAGRILEIAAADGEFVEQDQILMRIVPDLP